MGMQMKMNNLTHPLKIFFNRQDIYAIGFSNGSRAGYRLIREAITDELIDKHIKGVITLGAYSTDIKNNVQWCCFDFDENTLDDAKSARYLHTVLKKDGFSPLLEFSGGGKYKRHVWVFCEPTPASIIRIWANNVCNKFNTFPHEIFPKQDILRENQVGNLVKIPFGLHPYTKKRCSIYDEEKKEFSLNIELLNIFSEGRQ